MRPAADQSLETRSYWRLCGDVDGSGDPSLINDGLDAIASVAAITAAKQRSLDLLDLEPGGSVLDVGCGNGPDLPPLAAVVGARGRVVGVDRSKALLEVARARHRHTPGQIELVPGDALALPFADATFDACRADRTLQHLAQPDLGLAEMVRVTRSGGRIVVTEARWGFTAADLDPEATAQVTAVLASQAQRRHWLGYLLPMMFELAGLADVRAVSDDCQLDDYSEIVRFTNCEWAAAEAATVGRLSERAANQWLAGMRSGSVALTILHVSGTRR